MLRRFIALLIAAVVPACTTAPADHCVQRAERDAGLGLGVPSCSAWQFGTGAAAGHLNEIEK